MNGREMLAKVIADALEANSHPDCINADDIKAVALDGTFNLLAVADAIVAAGFGDVAAGIEAARDAIMPPLNWNLDPWTGNERPGTSTVDEIYHDVHRELTEEAEKVRAPAHPPLSTTAAESDTATPPERESAAQRRGEPQ